MKNLTVRRVLVVVLFALVLGGSALSMARAMWNATGGWVRTRQDDELIALAMASKDPTIGVLYLAKDTNDLQVLLQKVRALGGSVGHVDRAIDYIRATVPTQTIQQALDVPNGDVAAVDVDLSFHDTVQSLQPVETINPKPQDIARVRAEMRSAATLAFMRAPSPILHDLDADVWQRQHPTFDGRGVTVADVEELTDPLSPELSGALSLTGNPVRKIESFHIVVDPNDHSAPNHLYDFATQWVDMRARVSGTSSVRYQGATYTLPNAGTFRIGLFDFDKAVLTSHWVNPQLLEPMIGNGIFAVLWDPSHGLVWVDLQRSRNFRHARAMRDFNSSGQWAYFGSLHSKRYPMLTPAVSFGVLEDPRRDTVAIALGQGVHALGVTTTVVGHPIGPNDPVHGIAPAAQIASFEYAAYKLHSQAEAVTAAAEDPHVDVVVFEIASSIHTVDAASGEGWFLSALDERLVRTFDKPIFVPGGNGPQIISNDDAGLGADVMSVTGWQSAASYALYEGFRPAVNVHKHWGGLTDGPGQDGALKPDLAAPSGYAAAIERFMWDGFYQSKAGLYTLPVGYWDFGGTSQATPTAGGAAALLISAARQEHIPIHAIALSNAMRTAAWISPSLRAHEQGNGLIDVARTWALLERQARNGTAGISGSVCGGSVRTNRWPQGTPNGGAGILETIGWHPGDQGTRIMRFCFSHLPRIRLAASLLANDGTYRIAGLRSSGSSVAVDIHVRPSTQGFHSAIVMLHDANGDSLARGMIAIASAISLNGRNHYSTQQDILIPRPGYNQLFIDVPKGTDALVVHANRDLPFTIGFQDPSGNDFSYAPANFGPGSSAHSVTIPQPMAGTWTVLVLDDHDVFNSTHAILPVEAVVVHVTAQAVRVNRSSLDAPVSVFAPGLPLHEVGAVQQLLTKSGQFPSALPLLVPVDVPKDTDALMVDLSGSDSSVDGYLFNCTVGSTCAPYARILGEETDKRMTIPNVKPGHYYLALDYYAPANPGAALPSYQVSVFAYDHYGVPSGASTARAYEVNCDAPETAITSGPHCGLFIVP